MIEAFLSAEDTNSSNIPASTTGTAACRRTTGTDRQEEEGGGTITMQAARNFYLSSQKTYTRKLQRSSCPAYREGTEQKEILELYLNKIYLGQRAYGVGAAARVLMANRSRNSTWYRPR